MTTEEKAKAYDEALKRVSPLYEQAIKDGNPIWSTYEYLIPELRESEDERIRKELIEQVGYILPDKEEYDDEGNILPTYHKRIERYRAYLEKQKEHQETCTKFLAKILKHSAEGFRNVLKKKGIDYIPHESFWASTAGTFSKQECNEFYKWKDDMTMELVTEETPEYKKGFKDGLDASKKEQKPAESISQLTVQSKGVYKICPRCKERMVRDDSKVYTSMPPQYGYKCPKCGEMEFDTVMYDSPVDDKQKGQNLIMANSPQLKEQKPIELTSMDAIEACMLRYLQSAANRKDDDEIMEDTRKYKQELIGLIWQFSNPPKQEWSEEDNIGWDEAFAFVTRAEKAAKNEEELQNAVTAEKWLKEIKFKYYVHPVKPIEWSEEDEKMRDRIIDILNRTFSVYSAIGTSSTRLSCPTYKDEIDWLKSLRPSWKPSDEQMKEFCHVLEYVAERVGTSKSLEKANSLYDDLVKNFFKTE